MLIKLDNIYRCSVSYKKKRVLLEGKYKIVKAKIEDNSRLINKSSQ